MIHVSHRIWHMERYDRVLVLEGGRLVEEGTHHELMRAGGSNAERACQRDNEARHTC